MIYCCLVHFTKKLTTINKSFLGLCDLHVIKMSYLNLFCKQILDTPLWIFGWKNNPRVWVLAFTFIILKKLKIWELILEKYSFRPVFKLNFRRQTHQLMYNSMKTSDLVLLQNFRVIKRNYSQVKCWKGFRSSCEYYGSRLLELYMSSKQILPLFYLRSEVWNQLFTPRIYSDKLWSTW